MFIFASYKRTQLIRGLTFMRYINLCWQWHWNWHCPTLITSYPNHQHHNHNNYTVLQPLQQFNNITFLQQVRHLLLMLSASQSTSFWYCSKPSVQATTRTTQTGMALRSCCRLSPLSP